MSTQEITQDGKTRSKRLNIYICVRVVVCFYVQMYVCTYMYVCLSLYIYVCLCIFGCAHAFSSCRSRSGQVFHLPVARMSMHPCTNARKMHPSITSVHFHSRTPLHEACNHGHLAVAQILLDHNAKCALYFVPAWHTFMPLLCVLFSALSSLFAHFTKHIHSSFHFFFFARFLTRIRLVHK